MANLVTCLMKLCKGLKFFLLLVKHKKKSPRDASKERFVASLRVCVLCLCLCRAMLCYVSVCLLCVVLCCVLRVACCVLFFWSECFVCLCVQAFFFVSFKI